MLSKGKDWFKLKRYPHIGLPITPHDRFKWVEKYVTTPSNIAKHGFLPFIHRTSRVKKFRKEYNQIDGKVNKTSFKILRKPSQKKREIFYANHLDALIFGYYANILSEKYEIILNSPKYQLNEVVNAYRSLPINPTKENSINKSTIDFANEVFTYIRNYNHDHFNVIAFDITSFFDNLNHGILLGIWAEILGLDKLPPDHFNIYKNITRFSHVDIVDIFEEFKDRIYIQKINKFGKPLERKRKRIEKIKFLRNQNAIAFCTTEEFLKVKGKLLQPSKTRKDKSGNTVYRNFGIPQGSPISSILANIYLLYFDKAINEYVTNRGGVYRRYSDDIIIICPSREKTDLITLVHTEIKKYKLEIQPSKTQIFRFERKLNNLACGQEFNQEINWNKNLIYLGFEFDGENVLLKSASISKFYRKMKKYVRRAKYFAKKTGKGIFKKRIFKQFSYRGAKRIRRRVWNESKKKFINLDSYNYGNFLTYTYKAAKLIKNNKIKQQTSRHWNILNKLIKH